MIPNTIYHHQNPIKIVHKKEMVHLHAYRMDMDS